MTSDNKIKKAFLIILISCQASILCSQIVFQHSYNITSNYDMGYSVQETYDGNYIVAGYVGYYTGNGNVFLMKLNTIGDTLWTKEFGGIKEEEGWHVEQMADSGFIISADTKSFGAGDYDIYMIRTDKNGDVIWENAYGGPNFESGEFLTITPNGELAVVGYTTSYSAGLKDIHLMKLNSVGDTLWTKTFGGAKDEFGVFIRNTLEGGFILGGFTQSFGAGNWDGYLIKTDSNGDTIWTRTYGGNKIDQFVNLTLNLDSSYTMIGLTESFSSTSYNILMMKIDKNGEVVWSKKIEGPSYGVGYVIQSIPNGYIVGAIGYGHINSLRDEYLIKTDYDGNIIWAKAYGDVREECPFGLALVKNGYITVGNKQNPISLAQELFILKTDTSGFSGCAQGDITNLIVTDVIPKVGYGAIIGTAPWQITNTTSTISPYVVHQIVFCDSCSSKPVASFVVSSKNNLIVNFESEIIGANSFYWDFGDGNSSATNNPSHTYNMEGYYNVCLHVTNSCGNFTFCHTINVLETNIYTHKSESDYFIYPNPTTDKIIISSLPIEIMNIEVYNLIGELLSEIKVSSNQIEIDLTDFLNGIYFVKISSEDNYYYNKIIKK